MNTQVVRRITGMSGVTIGILAVTTIPLYYYMYTGNPPGWNVLTRNLITLVTLAVMIVSSLACAS